MRSEHTAAIEVVCIPVGSHAVTKAERIAVAGCVPLLTRVQIGWAEIGRHLSTPWLPFRMAEPARRTARGNNPAIGKGCSGGNLVRHGRLLNERQHENETRHAAIIAVKPGAVTTASRTSAAGKHLLVGAFVVVNPQTHLLQVVGALHTPCRFTSRLDRRQQQTNHHTDDCDHDQEFDQRESVTPR